jgi:hypothetical protein
VKTRLPKTGDGSKKQIRIKKKGSTKKRNRDQKKTQNPEK